MAGEPGGSDEEENGVEEDAGNEGPSGFGDVHAGIQKLDDSGEDHYAAECLPGAEAEQRYEHDGESGVADCEIAGVNVDC